MLFRADLYEGIRSGAITVAFRRWKRPTVAVGGTLRTPAGVLGIEELTPIAPAEVTASDARAAGFDAPEAVIAALAGRSDQQLYRVRFHVAGVDPRIARRSRAELGEGEVGRIRQQLDRWDRASAMGPWTQPLLDLIADLPGARSADLAARLAVDQPRLKRRARQLKELGLVESLGTGYRLAPRGTAYVAGSAHSKSRQPPVGRPGRAALRSG